MENLIMYVVLPLVALTLVCLALREVLPRHYNEGMKNILVWLGATLLLSVEVVGILQTRSVLHNYFDTDSKQEAPAPVQANLQRQKSPAGPPQNQLNQLIQEAQNLSKREASANSLKRSPPVILLDAGNGRIFAYFPNGSPGGRRGQGPDCWFKRDEGFPTVELHDYDCDGIVDMARETYRQGSDQEVKKRLFRMNNIGLDHESYWQGLYKEWFSNLRASPLTLYHFDR